LPGVVERDDAMGDGACGGGVVLVGIGPTKTLAKCANEV